MIKGYESCDFIKLPSLLLLKICVIQSLFTTSVVYFRLLLFCFHFDTQHLNSLGYAFLLPLTEAFFFVNVA